MAFSKTYLPGREPVASAKDSFAHEAPSRMHAIPAIQAAGRGLAADKACQRRIRRDANFPWCRPVDCETVHRLRTAGNRRKEDCERQSQAHTKHPCVLRPRADTDLWDRHTCLKTDRTAMGDSARTP